MARFRVRRRPRRRNVNVLPHLLTLGNLVCGLLAIVRMLDGQYTAAAWFIVLGGLFDISDGRVARLTHNVSDFGKELDSLSDLVTFGCAPALLVYSRFSFIAPGLDDRTLHRLALAGMLLFPCAAAIRLARYNLSSEEGRVFSGLPSPAAAGILASLTIMVKEHAELEAVVPMLALPLTVLLSWLMVSNVRYPKRGIFVVRRRTMPAYLFLCVGLAAFFVIMQGTTLFMIGFTYLGVGLMSKATRGRLTVPGLRETPVPPPTDEPSPG